MDHTVKENYKKYIPTYNIVFLTRRNQENTV